MARKWSHAPEAYVTAKKNLSKRSTKWLAQCYTAWICYHSDEGVAFTDEAYTHILRDAQTINKDVLIDYIWREAEKIRTCDNSGDALWMCPFGCHKVKC